MAESLTNKRKPQTKKQQRRNQFVSGTVLALVGFAVFRVVAGNQNPEMNIVWPTPPEHNAFATYAAATHGIGKTKGFNEAYDAVIGRRDVSKKPLPVPAAQIVAQNQVSLTLLRQKGFTHPFQIPPSHGLMDDTEYLHDFRSMAFLLVIEGDVRTKQGDLRGAIDSNLDAVRLGEDVSHNGGLIHYLTGTACQIIGQRGLWRQLKQYSASDSRYAVRRLEELSLHQQPLSKSLEGEKRYGQTTLRTLFTSPDAFSEKDADGTEEPRPGALAHWLNYRRHPIYAVWSKQTVWDNYTGYLDSHIRRSHERYNSKAVEIPLPNDFWSQILSPAFLPASFKEASFSAERRLLITALALQAYQREHNGKPPETLAELTPGYLTVIPDDPFAPSPNTPFRYRKESGSNRFVLYSVGPNGKDDGGKLTDNSHCQSGDPPWMKTSKRVFSGSEGDIISGLNF